MADRFHIKGFIPVSMLDWPGRLCSVLFLGGCGFRCPACHNYKLVLEPASIPDVPLAHIQSYLASRKGWIDGITVTGGEPTVKKDLPDLLKLFKARRVRIKLDTNGSNPAMLEWLIRSGLVDAVSMDVKAPLTEQEYSRVAGVPVDPGIIGNSIEVLKSSGIEAQFRTTVIPGMVEEPELDRIRDFLGEVTSFQIQAFRNVETLSPEFGRLEPFSLERLEEIRRGFEIPVPAEFQPKKYAYAG